MTIIVLYILLGIIALIVILLHFSLVISVKAGKEGLAISAKYLCVTVYPRKDKSKKTDSTEELETDDLNDLQDDDFSDSLEDELDSLDEHNSEEEEEKSEIVLENNTHNKPKTAAQPEKAKTEDKRVDEKAKKEKIKKEKNKKEKVEKDVSKTDNKPNKKGGLRAKIESIKEKYNKFKPYIPMGWKYFKKLLKTVRITVDDVQIDVGREDAHEAAIYYGMIQGAVAHLLNILSSVFTAKVKRLDVNCRFAKNIIGGSAEITVRVRPSAVIAIAVCLGVNFLIIYLKSKRKAKRTENAGVQPA